MTQSRPANAQPLKDGYTVSYFDVATSAAASRAGYGGPGSSGGAGDNTVRIINPTSGFGSLCALIYVFDDFEELQTCCGCPVSPDGQRTLSTLNDLTLNFGVHLANLNQGVIKIMPSLLNFNPSIAPGQPFPAGTNGTSAGACSPTGNFGDPIFKRSLPTEIFVRGIRAWTTHDESQQPGNVNGGKIAKGVSSQEFLDSPLDVDEYSNLQQNCEALISNSSGTGVCTCGVGDNTVVPGLII